MRTIVENYPSIFCTIACTVTDDITPTLVLVCSVKHLYHSPINVLGLTKK